jgi:TolB protein
MIRTPRTFHRVPGLAALLGLALLMATLAGQETPPPPPQQPSEVTTTITSGDVGAPPRLAVPDFIPLSTDSETAEAARVIAQVLWNDLNFEREFALIPRDTYASIPAARSMYDVPLDRWRELNADGVVIGTVQRTATGVRVEVRLFQVRTGQSGFARQYEGSLANRRLYAHTIADEIHQEQRALRGVARTRLTFNSDRDGERLGGTIENRGVKEIYIADYDGENQRRVTTQRSLNITSVWSPDARSIAYTSYRRGLPNIFISHIYEGTLEELTGNAGNNFLPSWSPDGTRIAFSSTRDGSGNSEIYVVNRDGTNVRRITNHPMADGSPTWSPSGTQIAFMSDRSGSPQIYVISADGVGQPRRITTAEAYADRPTWSPAPYNEIAYAARTGPGNDIKILDLATGQVMQLTFGEGTNESPSFSPNGRHIAFMSTRAGRHHIFTMSRDGRNVRQVTRLGNNYQPDWSRR